MKNLNNNAFSTITSLLTQCGNNPQMFAQNILKNNPEFAKAIQGQNPQELAMRELQRRGIDPNQIMRLIRR